MHPGYNDPIQFVGYPGDPPYSAALDMGYQGLTADFGAFIAWRTNPSYPLYQDNLTIQNHLYMLNQMETEGNGGYNTIRRIRYRNLWQGVDGANSACMDHRQT